MWVPDKDLALLPRLDLAFTPAGDRIVTPVPPTRTANILEAQANRNLGPVG